MNEFFIPLLLSGSLLLIVSVFIIARFLRDQQQKLEVHKGREKDRHTRYEQELLRSRLEVQEQAMSHISSEIQENIGQVLTGMQMKLMALSGRMADRQEASTFSEVASRMGKSIKDLRNLSHLLDGSMIEKIGLIDAIEKELAFVSSIYNLECTFTYSDQLPAMSGEQDILLFRIVQESLTNIFKHAAATTVTIHIGYDNDLLTLYIADNGVGIDLERYKDKGIGLQHINERIRLLKGRLDINTKPGEGTTLVLTCKL